LTLETLLILFVAGLLAGFLSGMFGVGGGIVIVPAIVFVYTIQHPESAYIAQVAIATSLFIIIFTSLSASYSQLKNHNVVIRAALIIGISSTVSVFIFSIIALSLPQNILEKIFLGILIFIGLRMLSEKKNEEDGKNDKANLANYSNTLCVIAGMITGAVAGLTGLGGAVFSTLTMRYIFKFPFKKSIGTSTLSIIMTSAGGVLSYLINMPHGVQVAPYALGMSDVVSALPVIAGSIPAARFGVYVHSKTNSFILIKLFAAFILVFALKMILF